MPRFSLYLPIFLLGVPLTVYLLATSGRTGAQPVIEDVPDVVLPEEGPLPSGVKMERLARADPIAFLENCLRRYDQEVHGYTCIMQKQERIDNVLHKKEIIEVKFREQPFSVSMHWLEGIGKADRALYIEGENNNQVLAHPSGVIARALVGPVVKRPVNGPEARQAGRYTLNDFGIKKGTLRTLNAWKAAREAGKLHAEYLGIQTIPEVGNRPCYVLRRTTDKPEEDGITEVTIYIDQENWLQVGSVLKGKNGQLVGAYYFRDLYFNPEFSRDAFQPVAWPA
jgi:hypothetical protein